MDPLEEMPPVVCCVLTRDGKSADYGDTPVQSLKLYYARRASETGYVSIPDASVSITADRQTYPFTWDGEKYTCAFWPQFATEYKLKITLADGHRITANTRYPHQCALARVSVYNGYSVTSSAGYCYLYRLKTDKPDNENEVYMWITPTVEGISDFITNHPGADDFNVIAGAVSQDLPAWPTMKEDYKEISNRTVEQCELEYWDRFEKMFVELPVHKSFLRIVHPLDYDNGFPEHLVHSAPKAPGGDVVQDVPETGLFIINTTEMIKRERPGGFGYIGPAYSSPCKAHFVSKEYDHYLRTAVNKSIHADELTSLYEYDLDADYSNIEGGIGIFGGLF